MTDYASWAKRKATRARPDLVPVEVDVHTATGVHRAIRYHRVEDAKKMIAEGKAHEIKEVGSADGTKAPPPISVTRSPPSPDYPHGKYQTTVLAQEKVGWQTKTGVPVDVKVSLTKTEQDYTGTGKFSLERDGYRTQIHVSLDGKPEEHGGSLDLTPLRNDPRGAVARLGRLGLMQDKYDKVQAAVAKVESHPEFMAYTEKVKKNLQEGEDYEKHVKAVENMMTVGGRST